MRDVAAWTGIVVLVALTTASGAIAQRPPRDIRPTQDARSASDIRGARDHALAKRFPGSWIVRYQKENSSAYTLPTGPVAKWDYAKGQPDFAGRRLELEGELTRITYVVRAGASSAEVFGALKSDLLGKGFKVIYEAKGADFGRAQGNLYQNLGDQLFEYSPKGAYFLSAKHDGAPATTYVALYVTEYEMGTTPVRIRPGQAILQLDIVDVRPVSDKLIVVSANDISKGLEASGRIALYGILFDSNKSEVKTESRPALDEIAKYLQANGNAKLEVVGHTDNVGSYDSNLDLSRARAAAVVRILVEQYNIGPQRLRPSGVGFLAPIASNAAEDGRAKNRRVELLPQ